MQAHDSTVFWVAMLFNALLNGQVEKLPTYLPSITYCDESAKFVWYDEKPGAMGKPPPVAAPASLAGLRPPYTPEELALGSLGPFPPLEADPPRAIVLYTNRGETEKWTASLGAPAALGNWGIVALQVALNGAGHIARNCEGSWDWPIGQLRTPQSTTASMTTIASRPSKCRHQITRATLWQQQAWATEDQIHIFQPISKVYFVPQVGRSFDRAPETHLAA
ncbi:uncharacterized protein PG986_011869 [Apiospora aurea]|uniref:Uncharacterized protein n=1 Tax=Apiospora aurea TaxID=335848 RepID=A0ABR1PZG9_9PEZI